MPYFTIYIKHNTKSRTLRWEHVLRESTETNHCTQVWDRGLDLQVQMFSEAAPLGPVYQQQPGILPCSPSWMWSPVLCQAQTDLRQRT